MTAKVSLRFANLIFTLLVFCSLGQATAADHCKRVVRGGFAAEQRALGIGADSSSVLENLRDAQALAAAGDTVGAARAINKGLQSPSSATIVTPAILEGVKAAELVYLAAPASKTEKRSYRKILQCMAKSPARGQTLHTVVGGTGAIALLLASDWTTDLEDIGLLGVAGVAGLTAGSRGLKLPAMIRACLKDAAQPVGEPALDPAAPRTLPGAPARGIVAKAKGFARIGLTILPWAVLAFDHVTDSQQRSRIEDPMFESNDSATPVELDPAYRLQDERDLDQMTW